ncbi:MAG: family 1 glycosylhydrolase [Chloroflexota bacterium]
MARATFHFPKSFLWGTATSSHQVEGKNNNNNWWAWEQQAGRIIENHKSGSACDWWGGRWREDFDRASETGQNAHRLSIEWSRVQPAPDRWDEEALDHYRQMMRGLHERGMTPLVTLHHFSDPLWFAETGGWEKESAPKHFAGYVGKVVTALKEYVTTWCTINEPNVLTQQGYLSANFPPGISSFKSAFQVLRNLVRAHAAAYHTIHELQPESRVGVVMYHRGFLPAKPGNPLDTFVTSLLSQFFNDCFPRALKDGVLRIPLKRETIPEAKGTQDFLGIDYYTQDRVAFDLRAANQLFGRRFYPPEADLSDTGFIANEPEGMFSALKWGLQFNIPIIVTENGVEDADDHLRPRYIAQHIHKVWRAVNFNWPIKGYFHWTLVDNFEWERGWTQRFGLWELDPETQSRIKRPSADLYASICRQNALSSDMVQQYCPEIYPVLFPE